MAIGDVEAKLPGVRRRDAAPAVGTARLEGSARRADQACLALLAGLWSVMVALANPIGDFPLNDDWVYGLAVRAILEQGVFRLPSSADANVLSQAYWGALFCLPFGFSFTALRVSTLVLGLLGVWAIFGTLRNLSAERTIAMFAAVLVAGNPLYFALANSFMTDVPFLATSALSLYFLVRWTVQLHARDALFGVVLSMLAILIRQAAIVIPLGFAIALVLRRGPSLRVVFIAIIPVLLGMLLHFALRAWVQQTVHAPLVSLRPQLDALLNTVGIFTAESRLFFLSAYVGMFSLPLVAYAAMRTWRHGDSAERLEWIAVFAAASVSFATIWATTYWMPMPLLGNVLNVYGIGPLTLRDTFAIEKNLPDVPGWLTMFWYGATAAAIAGFALLANVVGYAFRSAKDHRWNSATMSAMAMIASSGLVYALLAVVGVRYLFDRYALFLLLPIVLFTGLVSSQPLPAGKPSSALPRGMTAALALPLVLQAVLALAATRDYLEWNRMRWTAIGELITAGVAPTLIDGGYEFNGWTAFDRSLQKRPDGIPGWVGDKGYVITSGPIRGYSVVRTYPFKRWLTTQTSEIAVLRPERRP